MLVLYQINVPCPDKQTAIEEVKRVCDNLNEIECISDDMEKLSERFPQGDPSEQTIHILVIKPRESFSSSLVVTCLTASPPWPVRCNPPTAWPVCSLSLAQPFCPMFAATYATPCPSPGPYDSPMLHSLSRCARIFSDDYVLLSLAQPFRTTPGPHVRSTGMAQPRLFAPTPRATPTCVRTTPFCRLLYLLLYHCILCTNNDVARMFAPTRVLSNDSCCPPLHSLYQQ
jgi:hypothetical protein